MLSSLNPSLNNKQVTRTRPSVRGAHPAAVPRQKHGVSRTGIRWLIETQGRERVTGGSVVTGFPPPLHGHECVLRCCVRPVPPHLAHPLVPARTPCTLSQKNSSNTAVASTTSAYYTSKYTWQVTWSISTLGNLSGALVHSMSYASTWVGWGRQRGPVKHGCVGVGARG